jgi:enamidase
MRSLIENGQWLGPDLDVSGPYLHGPHWFKSIIPITARHEYETVEDARQAAQYWAGRGVTSFKAFLGLSPEQLRAVVEVAREHKLKVAAHLCNTTASEAAMIGIDSLEHGLTFATELHPDKKPGSCPSFPDLVANMAEVDVEGLEVETLIGTLVSNDVAVTPTFAAAAYFACHEGLPRAVAKSLLTANSWPQWHGHACPSSDLLGLSQEVRSHGLANSMAFARKFADAGGLLLAGTDGLAGADTLFEIELFVEAGFSPVEAIKIATHNGATYLERLDGIGTLEEGKRADLVLVRGRPDQRISDIRNSEIVFKNGVGFDSEALLESVSGTIGN